MRPRTFVYIDGFNFYYGSVRRTPYRWLNLLRFCEAILPKNMNILRAPNPNVFARANYMRILQTWVND